MWLCLCPWRKEERLFRWLAYDGDTGELKTPAMVRQYLDQTVCSHHPITELGDPLCDIRQFEIMGDDAQEGTSFPSQEKRKRSSNKSRFLSVWKRIFSG